MVQDRNVVFQWKTDRKSFMTYRIARLPVTLSEVEGHFCCFKPLCYP